MCLVNPTCMLHACQVTLLMSDFVTLWTVLCQWDSPGRNTGVGGIAGSHGNSTFIVLMNHHTVLFNGTFKCRDGSA